MRESISIVVPVFNEEENIYSFVNSVFEWMPQLKVEWELIVVNDGSRDKTEEVLNRLGEKFPDNLRIISYRDRKGYGYALREGIKEAKKEWIVFVDGDNQFHISSLSQFWRLKDEFNLLLGYRSCRQDNLYRRCLGKIGNFCANLYLRRKYPYIKDINCGFKMCKKDLIKPLSLESNGGMIYFEMLYKFPKDKVKIAQIPVKHFSRKFGSSTGGRILTILTLLKEALNLLCHWSN